MVNNLDIVVKKYPDIICELLSNGRVMAVDISTGEVCGCTEIDCSNCIFSDENNSKYDLRSCGERIINWLNEEVKVIPVEHVDEKHTDTRNSQGEITW